MSTWSPVTPKKTPVLQQNEIVQTAQAKVVQHHYVRAQVHTINADHEALILKTFDALRERPEYSKSSNAELVDVFRRMTKRLQEAEICINFKASSWFMNPNNYESYTQMYERAVRNVADDGQSPVHQMRLKNDPINDAKMRVLADDTVTFPPHMRQDQNKYKAIDPKSPYGAIGRVMTPGVVTNLNGTDEWVGDNPFFNPKSKQVFAALNYGRRPHGACTAYGNSRLVLNPKLMVNLIYFAGDTFYYRAMNVSAEHQISYRLLAAIYAKTAGAFREDLYKSCILNQSLPDTGDGHLLMEAHLFEPLRFAGNLSAMYISRLDEKTGKPLPLDAWSKIKINATNFHNKFILGLPQKDFIDS